jgi:hypothetical protein
VYLGKSKRNYISPLTAYKIAASSYVAPSREPLGYEVLQMSLKGFAAGGAITKAAATTTGAAAGSIIPFVGTAAGAAIGSLVGSLVSGKAHYSPWNFLYDDYPQHIYENEAAIVTLKNAINSIIAPGSAVIPSPPMYSKTGGSQYQTSMQAIVPQYVPGSESQIANYNRALNESGGAYEKTFGMQLALIPQLQAQLQQVQGRAQQVQAQPIPGSATSPAPVSQPLPQFFAPPVQQGPQYFQPQQPQQIFVPSAAPASAQAPNITITSPGQLPQMQPMQSDILSSPYMPYMIGGAALLLVLALTASKGKK